MSAVSSLILSEFLPGRGSASGRCCGSNRLNRTHGLHRLRLHCSTGRVESGGSIGRGRLDRTLRIDGIIWSHRVYWPDWIVRVDRIVGIYRIQRMYWRIAPTTKGAVKVSCRWREICHRSLQIIYRRRKVCNRFGKISCWGRQVRYRTAGPVRLSLSVKRKQNCARNQNGNFFFHIHLRL